MSRFCPDGRRTEALGQQQLRGDLQPAELVPDRRRRTPIPTRRDRNHRLSIAPTVGAPECKQSWRGVDETAELETSQNLESAAGRTAHRRTIDSLTRRLRAQIKTSVRMAGSTMTSRAADF